MRNKPFTLVELIVAMAVFMVIMLALMNFFTSAQKIWISSSMRNSVFEDARIALEIMSKDIQSAYRGNNMPFWHRNGTTEYDSDLLAFVSATSIPPNDRCTSEFCEVKYVRYLTSAATLATHANSNDGWLLRSVTGDKKDNGDKNTYPEEPSGKYNILNSSGAGNTTVKVSDTGSPLTASLTADDTSSEAWQKLIPHVTKLEFKCYKKDTNPIDADNDASPAVTEFPAYIEITLTLLDKSSWDKWVSMGGAVNPSSEPDGAVKNFRLQNERTFTKVVFLGDR